jgi:hypothetical protein
LLPLTTYPLDAVAEAWERQAGGAQEKIVITF